MCGLSFLFDAVLARGDRCERMSSALKCLSHRGPDEQGVLDGDGWSIGHRRLSIIDLQTSHQPMVTPDRRYFLAYNGEVYNYRELRRRLVNRWQFTTSGDTEVVLAGLSIDGPEFLDQMEGMWALVLWDALEQSALLSRDRMGKKPLYYSAGRSDFACASELPALSRLCRRAWQSDLDSAADYFRYGFYLPGTTAYEGVSEVLPGHWLTWSPGVQAVQRRYWSLPIGGYQGTRDQANAELRSLLEQAIDRRLVSDVEVGAFLSGGVDSSLVIALQTARASVPPKTFTIGFSEASYDERQYARLVSAKYGTAHFEEVLCDWNVERLVNLIANHVGQPFADPSILPTALVSELAGRHVKVVLSGDGGDELFCGYQRYHARSIMRWYTRLPQGLRSAAEGALRALPEPVAHHSHSLLKKMHLFLDTVRRAKAESRYVAPLMYADDDFRALVPELVGCGHSPPGLPEACELDDIQGMMLADALIYLPQDILLKVDRASMAHSLEARAPFLDRQVVEFSFGLPPAWHRSGLSGKRMLHDAFKDLLPASIWQRRKQGFGVPLGQWFLGGLSGDLLRLVERDSDLVSASAVHRLVAEHKERRRDHGLKLWQVYVFLLWHTGRNI